MVLTSQESAAGVTSARDTLRSFIGSAVHFPGSDTYKSVIAGFDTATVHRPAAVVVATTAADVAAAVRLAGAVGFSVTCTGHGDERAPSNSILIDTAGMNSVTIDHRNSTATVGAGARWQQVLAAAAPYGLAGPAGSSGFAADHVMSMEVVTADGYLRRVDAVTESDLFWALLVGGGALGIVTQMTFGLFPIEEIDGDGRFFDPSDSPAVLHPWCEWAEEVPEKYLRLRAIRERYDPDKIFTRSARQGSTTC